MMSEQEIIACNSLPDDYYSYNNSAFGKLAPFYNFICLPFTLIREKVVAMSGAGEGDKVLDVCTGTGSQAFAFGETGCAVTGVDISPHMLAVAQRKNRYGKVTFEIADATRLPFPDKHFDIATISFALHDMPRQARHRVLDEMGRVSKKVVAVDYHIPENSLERWVHVFFTGLYEGRYYRDFARQDFRELLGQHCLRVTGEACALVNYVKIWVCEPVQRV